MEPVLENIGIVLPDEGYLEAVRSLCDQYKIVLIFDEVKTGLTAGPQGAAQRLGVIPDLICMAKSIGGGIPLAAFGGKAEFMQPVTDGRMPHLGGQPLLHDIGEVLFQREFVAQCLLPRRFSIGKSPL